MQIRSTAFANGDCIPVKYTADGDDQSPPLEWSGLPSAVQELALICDDPDAPTPEPWVHWVLYQIPAGAAAIAEGTSHSSMVPGVEGKNSWSAGQTLGYRGPAPPRGHGIHHYRFRLYALDTKLPFLASMDKEAILHAIEGHVLTQAELVGLYERK